MNKKMRKGLQMGMDVVLLVTFETQANDSH